MGGDRVTRGRAGCGVAGSHVAPQAYTGPGFSAGDAPSHTGHSPIPRQGVRGASLDRLCHSLSCRPDRLWLARTSHGSLAWVGRECRNSWRPNASRMGRYTQCRWSLWADTLEHAGEHRCRDGGGMSTKRRAGALGGRVVYRPRFGPYGRCRRVCLQSPQSSDDHLCNGGWAFDPAGACQCLAHCPGPSRGEHDLRGSHRPGGLSAHGLTCPRGAGQGTAESRQKERAEEGRDSLPSSPDPVSLASLAHPCPWHERACRNGHPGLAFPLAHRAQVSVVAEFSALRLSQDEARRRSCMASVWPHALHCAACCPVSAAACNALAADKTCTQRAATRPACPRRRGPWDAGHLLVRDGTVPLAHTRLCHRRTVGGQGGEHKTNNGAHTAREFAPTRRVS